MLLSQEEERRCKGYRYSIYLILVCIRLIINASSSFRNVSASLETIFSSYPYFENRDIPNPKTVSRWLTQVGCYKLKRKKEIAEDWVYIIDNSIQVGKQKCLLILGFRLSQILEMRSLRFEDMEPLALEVHNEVNADVVDKAISKAAIKTGIPRMICSDEGPDVKPGVLQFVEKHPKTSYIPDTIHKSSNLLKAELKENARWKEFTRLAKETKVKIQLTEIGFLVPPNQRSKCRFMNVDQLVHWALKMLRFLESEECFSSLHRKPIEEHLSWLRDFKEDIKHFGVLSHLLSCARETVRRDGIHNKTQEKFDSFLMDLPLSIVECQFAGKILDFFEEQSSKAKPWEILHGSSEVIESLFGKLKSISKIDSTKGFSHLLLAAAACVGKTDYIVISEALDRCRWNDVEQWVKENIGKTVISKRRLALKPLDVTEEIFSMPNLNVKVDGLFRENSERIVG